jgi:hypothetical protein
MSSALSKIDDELAKLQATQGSLVDATTVSQRQAAAKHRAQLEENVARTLGRIEEMKEHVAELQRKLGVMNAAVRGGVEESQLHAQERLWHEEQIKKFIGDPTVPIADDPKEELKRRRRRLGELGLLLHRAHEEVGQAQPRIAMFKLIENGMNEADARRLARLDEAAADKAQATARETVTIHDEGEVQP